MSKKIFWSDWLDFSNENISKTPNAPGVFMMHESMKILFIGGADNIRDTLQQHFIHPCVSKATRFRFRETEDHEETKQDLLKDYQERHQGKLPKCMEEVH